VPGSGNLFAVAENTRMVSVVALIDDWQRVDDLIQGIEERRSKRET
jgi:hypothetical protein